MIYIDRPVDLNLEDDEGRNVARLADAVTPNAVIPGTVLVAGTSRAWSWAVVDSVDSGFVYFRQISAQDAARRGPLIKPLPRAGTLGLVFWLAEGCPGVPADLVCQGTLPLGR